MIYIDQHIIDIIASYMPLHEAIIIASAVSLESRSYELSDDTLYDASARGQIDLIKWLSKKIQGGWKNAMNWAARNGHLETVIWLHKNRTEGCTTNAMDWAARNGHLETVIWLHENRTEGCTTNAMDWAARNGHLETIIWLHENRTEGCTTNAMDWAAGNRHFETLLWLRDNIITS